jgi:hypothetical protein
MKRIMALSYERLKQYTDLAKAYIDAKVKKDNITKVSELENDAGYITDKGTAARAISDKNGKDIADTYLTKTEGAALKSSAVKFSVVTTLPTTDIQKDTIYFVKSDSSSDTDTYTEYVYVENKWEKLGHEVIQVDPDITEKQVADLWNVDIMDADNESF